MRKRRKEFGDADKRRSGRGFNERTGNRVLGELT